jgi:hypothetical protein
MIQNRMVQEFQSTMQLGYRINLKNSGSICDSKYQSEMHFDNKSIIPAFNLA